MVLGLPVTGGNVGHAGPGGGLAGQCPVQGQWQAAQLAEISPALAAALAANQANSPLPPSSNASASSWWLAVVGGLIGGLLLNLMPCVFPVLAIKLLGFAAMAAMYAPAPGRFGHTAGRCSALWPWGRCCWDCGPPGATGLGLSAAKPAGHQWPGRAVTVLGLNLAGVFEFGQFLPSGVAGLHCATRWPMLFIGRAGRVAIASP